MLLSGVLQFLILALASSFNLVAAYVDGCEDDWDCYLWYGDDEYQCCINADCHKYCLLLVIYSFTLGFFRRFLVNQIILQIHMFIYRQNYINASFLHSTTNFKKGYNFFSFV